MMKKNKIMYLIIIGLFFIYEVSANYIFDHKFLVDGETKQVKAVLPDYDTKVKLAIDEIRLDKISWKNVVFFSGWAFIPEIPLSKQKKFIVLSSQDKNYIFNTNIETKISLSEYFDEYQLGLKDAGFSSFFSPDIIKDGLYRIGIYIESENDQYLTMTNRWIKKNKNLLTINNIINSKQDIKLPQENKETTIANIDNIKENENNLESEIEITGWGFLNKENAKGSKIFLVFKSDQKEYIFDTFRCERTDVRDAYDKQNLFDLEHSGFYLHIPKKELENGNYQIGIYIEKENKKGLTFFENKYIDI